jgi:hypothetical protein
MSLAEIPNGHVFNRHFAPSKININYIASSSNDAGISLFSSGFRCASAHLQAATNGPLSATVQLVKSGGEVKRSLRKPR